jgi:amino acid adenylation domain-containing protein
MRGTSVEALSLSSIPHAFRATACRASSNTAVRHRDTALTYSELAGSAGAIAARLRAGDVGPGGIVATLLDRSPHCVAAALGIMATGAAYVHIEPTDPDARVADVLTAVSASAVLTDRSNVARLPTGTRRYVVDGEPFEAPYVPHPDLAPGDLAYLVLTSGSTGTPKAVAVEHGALLGYHAAFRQAVAPLTPDSYGITTTFAADLGKTCVYGALLSGARLDVYDRDITLDADAFAAQLRANPVGCLKFTPSHLGILAAESRIDQFLPTELLLLAGETLPPRLAGAILAARPDLAVYNSYGPAETTVAVAMHRVVAADAHRERVPIGRPLSGVRIRLVGPDGEPVPDGEAGVLEISGDRLARGYHGDPALTRARFVVRDDRRWYRTGDLVRHDPAGDLEFLGRDDRQLKIRGYRVEPGEVEAALSGLPGVRQAVVAGVQPSPSSPVELVAYVVAAARPSDLTGPLHGLLPAALVPGRLHVVPSIPIGMNGKADLAALRAMADAQVPRAAMPDPPRTDAERLIAGVWTAVLGRDEIGRHERFLEIGGDSFKLLAVFGRLRRSFPGIGIATLFAHPTIAGLATALAAGDCEPPPARPGPAAPVVEL